MMNYAQITDNVNDKNDSMFITVKVNFSIELLLTQKLRAQKLRAQLLMTRI